MTVRQCGPTCFSWQPGGGGGAAAVLHTAAAAPPLLAPCGLSLGLSPPAGPAVRCLAAEGMPGTPSERSRAGADRASPPPPVDTLSVRFERRSPTSRFDALFLAAQQELSSVRPACSVRSTRIVSRRAAVKRTQRDSSSGSSSSGSSGGSAGRSRVARVTPSPLATASGACSKPQRASTRAAAQSQAALQSKRQQMQGAAPAAAVLTPHTAASLRRLIVLRALVAALLRAPSPPRASCRAQHMASKLAPLLPAREQMEEQRQLEEARRFLRRF